MEVMARAREVLSDEVIRRIKSIRNRGGGSSGDQVLHLESIPRPMRTNSSLLVSLVTAIDSIPTERERSGGRTHTDTSGSPIIGLATDRASRNIYYLGRAKCLVAPHYDRPHVAELVRSRVFQASAGSTPEMNVITAHEPRAIQHSHGVNAVQSRWKLVHTQIDRQPIPE